MAIDIKLIKELRETTGAGVLDAKKALESCGGDLEAATRLLREKGLAKAAKRAGRETAEGRVEGRSYLDRQGLIVEVNCETDFVGRNEAFVAFANRVADHLFARSHEGQALEELLALPFEDDPNNSPAEMLKAQMSSTGENMAVRRYERFELGDRPGMIEVYVHPGNRVVVMVEMNSESPAVAAGDAFGTLVHDLALHVAAMAPLFRTREDIPAATLEAEKATYRQMALKEGKPERIVERIIEGRLKKYYEGTVLMEQPFVKDDDVTIGGLLAQKAAELGEQVAVRRFVRYELGEELD